MQAAAGRTLKRIPVAVVKPPRGHIPRLSDVAGAARTAPLPQIRGSPFDNLRPFAAARLSPALTKARKGRVTWLPDMDRIENFWSESGVFRGMSPRKT